jgi:hypothetical protein
MTAAEIRKALHRRPFRPITIKTPKLEITIRDREAIWQVPAPNDDVICLHPRMVLALDPETPDLA